MRCSTLINILFQPVANAYDEGQKKEKTKDTENDAGSAIQVHSAFTGYQARANDKRR